MSPLNENMVHSGVKDSTQHIHTTFYINYRYSPEHYEAMINPKRKYFGCSHIYFGKNRIPESRSESGKSMCFILAFRLTPAEG